MAAKCTLILVNSIILSSQRNSSQFLLTCEEFLCEENYRTISNLLFLEFVFL